jgi:hypothetical protein
MAALVAGCLVCKDDQVRERREKEKKRKKGKRK